MKVDRHGRAAVLTEEQLDSLMDAAPSARYRAIWAVQRWTAGRISEVLALTWGDINGKVTYRRGNTKTKITRQLPTAPRLESELATYRDAWSAEHDHAPSKNECLFPAKGSTHSPMTRQAADKTLRQVCMELGLNGVSNHSFRRSLATAAVRRGVSLHVIQKVTGHKSLGSLGHYLEANDDEVMAAIVGDTL